MSDPTDRYLPDEPSRLGDVTLPPAVADPDATMPPAPRGADAPAPDAAVPGYEVLGVLGRGGMGVVYKARQASLDRVVALKMILSGSHAGADEVARFRTEAEAIARVQHPNIVAVYEIGDHGGHPFMALEFCGRGSLETQLDGTPRTPPAAAQLVRTLAAAMQAAHDKGVVHRDLKPANVLTADDGTPKVTDFGLAKKLDAAGQTQTGAIVGTPSYMAPEQAQGRKDVGPAADVYALGAILYELLTGRPPFRAATPMDTVLQVLSEEPVPPSRLNPKVPRDLETVALKCLSKDPRRRYARAADLADDLGRFLAGEPVQARPVGRLERAWRWARKNPTGAAALGLLALLLMAAVAVPALIATREAGHARTLAQEKRRAQRQAAEATLDRALGLCELGEVGPGLIELTRALDLTLAAGDAELEEACRWNLGTWVARMPRLTHIIQGSPGPFPFHELTLCPVAFSPDEALLVGGGDDKVRVWKTATGEPHVPPLPHPWKPHCFAFVPGTRRLLTGGEDGVVRLWDADTGKQLAEMTHDADPGDAAGRWPYTVGVASVAVSPDGTRMASGGYDRTLCLWSLPDGKLLGRSAKYSDAVISAAISADGRLVYAGTYSGEVSRWDVAGGKALPGKIHAPRHVTRLLSLSGATVVGLAHTLLIRPYPNGDVAPFDTLRTLQGVSRIDASADGTLLAAVAGRSVRLWDPTRGEPRSPLLMHEGVVSGLALSRSGRHLATADEHGRVRHWRLPAPWPLHMLRRSVTPAVAFAPDSRSVFVGEFHKPVTERFDVRTGDRIGPIIPSQCITLAAGADGRAVYTRHLQHWQSRRWDAATGEEWPFAAPEGGVFDQRLDTFELSPDGTRLMTSGAPFFLEEEVIRFWDAATGKPVGPATPIEGSCSGIGFEPTGRFAHAWGSKCGILRFDPGTGRMVGSAALPAAGTPLALAAHPDGKTMVGGELLLQSWDIATGSPRGVAMRHSDRVTALNYSADGRLLLAGTFDGSGRVWHPATGKPVGPPLRHAANVTQARWSPDGRLMATATWGWEVGIWESPVFQAGPPEVVRSEIEALTGLTVAGGLIRPLEPEAWRQRRAGTPMGP